MEDRDKGTGPDRFFLTSPDLMCLLENGHFIRINRAFEMILGYSSENVIMTDWLDYIHPDDRKQADERLTSVVSGVPSMRFESRFRSVDCEYRQLEWSLSRESGQNVILAAARDIAVRKGMEASYQKNEARLNEAQRVAHIGSFSHDLDSGEGDWSDEMYRVLGYGPGEVKSEFDRIKEVLDEKGQSVFLDDLARLLSGKWPVDSYFRFRRRQGGWRYGHAWMGVEADSSNRPIRIYGTIQDITRQKTTEEKLRLLASELAMTESRERRQVAHDLHDQVGQVLFLAKMKLDALKQVETNSTAMELTNQAAALIDQAMQDIRTLTMEISPPALRMLGLEAALSELSDKLSLEHGVRISIQDDFSPKPLSDDMKDLVFRAVREILINAVKHSRTESIIIRLSSETSCIVVEVEDFGRGFDVARVLGNIEKPKGYGLFSIRERLQHLGGRLEIDSALGRGTRVSLLAPFHFADDCPRTDER